MEEAKGGNESAEIPLREEFYAAMIAKIEAVAIEIGAGALPPIADTDDLFSIGAVDSLAMLELIEFVEQVIGAEIDFTLVDPEVFLTLRGSYDFIEASRNSNARGVRAPHS